MKREGRQHGMVRTCRILPSPWNPRPDSRFINRFDSPPTAGLFTKVLPRPTNHSKFTGKCGKPRCNGCHMHPSCKSKDKTKGTQKLKSHDVLSNYRLMSWRVVDGKPGLNFSGFSASRILDHMDDDERYVDDDDYEETIAANVDDGDDDDIDDGDDTSYCDVGFLLDQVEGDEDWCLVAEL
ncbi:uncharacterized protein LOC8260322 [Ricinus communis]|uniref:Uncharacterized protein n=1 Tax=Ricinus communis TaxID=3988 RepID=B9SLR9_RICCO|nr:uncharacterized protein LOC8260322 [Ricinus communis]EEF35425.1 hypothetical protein RCOM_0530890 [Ricinus communis]|eukprot:XP_002526938.1 uncharacterized protein LOC8260322 [Ricinus communis]